MGNANGNASTQSELPATLEMFINFPPEFISRLLSMGHFTHQPSSVISGDEFFWDIAMVSDPTFGASS